jgi:hypothetical protein
VGFDFDKYKSGGNFINAAEKKVLAEQGIPFSILKVRNVHKFDREGFELTIRVPNPESGADEERTLDFPIGSGADSRDATLAGLQTYLEENPGEEVRAKVTKIGRAYFIDAA